MLALARRSVVTDHVETLLKIGLGQFGRASIRSFLGAFTGVLTSDQSDLLLARYTCVALQRLNGSVKKVKGTCDPDSCAFPV